MLNWKCIIVPCTNYRYLVLHGHDATTSRTSSAIFKYTTKDTTQGESFFNFNGIAMELSCGLGLSRHEYNVTVSHFVDQPPYLSP